jgi:spermidine/putrescine transport system permease protein
MLLTLYSSLEGIDYGVIEASRDLGATRIEIAKDVVVPLSAQGLITGCVFVFVPALGTFITPQFLARGKFTMIAEVLTARINELYAINYGAAGSLFLIIPTLIAFAIVMRTTSLEAMG